MNGAGQTETIIAFFFITASAGIRDATTYEQMRKRIMCKRTRVRERERVCAVGVRVCMCARENEINVKTTNKYR